MELNDLLRTGGFCNNNITFVCGSLFLKLIKKKDKLM